MAEVLERVLILSAAELSELTDYMQSACQLEELKRQGFYRARRNRLGHVILERAHYEAVCAGHVAEAAHNGPSLRPPKLRRAA